MKRNWWIAAGVVILVVLGAILMRFKGAQSSASPAVTLEKEKAVPVGKFDAALKAAVILGEQGELLKAQEAYKNLMIAYASAPGIDDVQKKLEDVNIRILFSAVQVENLTATREIKEGDSLSMIADEYHTTVDFIKKQNGLTSDIIRPGMRLRVWTGRLNVLVDKSQNLLILKSDGDVIKTYRVSTGKNNITPVGTFKVVTKLVKPAWTHEGKVIPADSPENILGTRWLGFNIPGYGIHGTTQPESIGTQATAGCVRMMNNEVEELYDLLPMGTEVVIMD